MLLADSPFARLPAPGPHPAPAELRAYAAGALAPAEEHRIEQHTQDCERCADVVDGLALTDAATTDQALAALRTRLQARVGATEPKALAAGWAWPRVAAAVALLGLVGGGLWTWEQHEAPVAPATARLETAAPAVASAAPVLAEPATTPAATPAAPAAAPVPQGASAPLVAAAPKARPRPDYAVVLPSQIQKSSRASRPSPATPGASKVSSEASSAPLVMADEEAVNTDKTTASRLDSPPEPAESDAKQPIVVSASAPSPLVTKRKAAAAGNASADDGASSPAPDNALPPPAAAPAPVSKGLGMRMPAAPSIGPTPVGGTTALHDYVRQQIAEFEPDSKAPTRSGIVRVRFVVGADGKLSDLRVVRGLGPPYDAEALRIVGEGPAWRPGVAGGRRAPLPAEVEVPF